MTNFPNTIYSPRTKQNKKGVVYHPEIATTFYAEDITLLDAEVVAIETELEAWLDQAVKTSSSPTFANLTVTDYFKIDKVYNNLKIGYQAGKNEVPNSSNNLYIGNEAGLGAAGVQNFYNVGLGGFSLHSIAGACYNVAIGHNAMHSSTTGNYNVAIGYQALGTNVDGVDNLALGYNSLINNTSGSTNVGVGTGCLQNNATGSGNIGIGFMSGAYETGSNAFYVDNQDRTDTAGDKAKALLYGVFAATAAAQTLAINAALSVAVGINIPTGQTYKINNSALAQANIVGLTTSDTPSFASLNLTGGGGVLGFQHSGVTRWVIQGHTYADNFYIRAYDNTGTEITPIPFTIENPAGSNITINRPVVFNSNCTFGDASTDTYTCVGRFIVRTAGSDPQHATPASRPAGSLKEIVSYASKLYFCTNASTPTWEKITSA